MIGTRTAFRWYGLELDGFKLAEVRDAYRFLSATPDETQWLEQTVATLRAAAR